MRRTTRNPNPPITVIGKLDVPVCEVLTLDTKDRPELTIGRPLLVNKRRYILTRREPAELGEPGAQVYIVLGLDKSTRAQRRQQAHASKKQGSAASPALAEIPLLTDAP